MIKTFCDSCSDEITDKNSPHRKESTKNELGRLTAQVFPKVKGGEILSVSVITASEGTWNKGHFCKYCIIDAISSLDDRPRQA